jgi:hypothetical protein
MGKYQNNHKTNESISILFGASEIAKLNLAVALNSASQHSKPLLLISIFLACAKMNWKSYLLYQEEILRDLVATQSSSHSRSLELTPLDCRRRKQSIKFRSIMTSLLQTLEIFSDFDGYC